MHRRLKHWLLCLSTLTWTLLPGSIHAAPPLCRVLPGDFFVIAPDLWVRPARSHDPQGWTEPTLVWVNDTTLWIADPGPHRCAGQALRTWLQQQWPQRRHHLINTHAHPENVLANSAWPPGTPIHASAEVRRQMSARCPNCLRHMREVWGEKLLSNTSIVLPNRLLHDQQKLLLGHAQWVVHLHTQTHTESALVLWQSDSLRWFGSPLIAWSGVPELGRSQMQNWMDILRAWQAKLPGQTLILGGSSPQVGRSRLQDTLAYLEAASRQVHEDVEMGRNLPDLQTWSDLVSPDDRDVRNLQRHEINLQKLWRDAEDAFMLKTSAPLGGLHR